MRDTTRKIIMICTVMALLLVSGANIFASNVGALPVARKNGMMDRIREKVEEGVRDNDNDGNPNLTDPNDNGNAATTDNGGTTTAPNQGTDSQTGSADPATSNDPATTTTPDTTKAETTTQGDNSDVLEDENGGGFNWWGIIIAVAIAAAVVILIIALLPKK